MKAGGEVRRQINNNVQDNIGSGLYNFDNLFTAQNPYIWDREASDLVLCLGWLEGISLREPVVYRNYIQACM